MKKLAIIALLLTGVLHLVEAPEYFEESAYIGTLFYLNFLAALLGSFWISKGKINGWHLGFFVSIFSIVAFVLSRSVGLPFFTTEIGEWTDESAIVSIVTEALFLGAYFKHFGKKN